MNTSSLDVASGLTASLDPSIPVVRSKANSASRVDLDQIMARLDKLEQLTDALPDSNSLNILVFDSSRDRLLAAMVIATGAAACGMDVKMFFTFWGTAALKKSSQQIGSKSLVERAFGWMLPGGVQKTKLSKMDMCGIGRALMSREMRKKKIADLQELFASASELGVQISVCEMSMQLMGIRREELIDYPQLSYCGVATFADLTTRSNTTLFI